MRDTSYIPKLTNAPLREVIFELRWLLGVTEGGVSSDIKYPITIGRFHDNILKNTYFNKYIEIDAPKLGLISREIPLLFYPKERKCFKSPNKRAKTKNQWK